MSSPHRIALFIWSAFVLLFVANAQVATSPNSEQLQNCGLKPATLKDLLALDKDALARVDIDRMNLLCAEDIQGTEMPNIATCSTILDQWASHVASETARNYHRFLEHPEEFNFSEAYYRVLLMIVVLQEDYGVHYDPARITSPDKPEPEKAFYANPNDIFISGLLGPGRFGTCASMPVLYTAVGRRLGYPLKLVLAKAHLFGRWEDGKERFNIDATGHGLSTESDEYYKKWPYPMSEAELASGMYLKSLTPAEELASFLQDRGIFLKVHGNADEALMAFKQAQKLAPNWADANNFFMRSVAQEAATEEVSRPLTHAEIDAMAEQVTEFNRQMQLYQERRRHTPIGAPPPMPPQMPGAPAIPFPAGVYPQNHD